MTRPGLVVFDLDGTITRRDTLLPYAWGFLVKKPLRIALVLGVLPVIGEFLLRRADEGRVKASFIKAALGGSTRAEIDSGTARFVPRLLARGVFANALERIAEHRSRGDYLVLMSASTDLYVPTIARELGFAETICTEVRWDGERLNGELTTPNRRGKEKARCFTALRERHPGRATVAYGNTASDLPHLRLADQGVLVNGSACARCEARRLGITCVDWQ
ncbi:MAG: HAD-IB family hydrolase [Steroidobacteraceae bacterium]